MHSLSPGSAGAKEAFGISIIRENYTIKIPPNALAHYHISDHDRVLLTTGHTGSSGFGLIKKDTVERSVFKKSADQLNGIGDLRWFGKRAYVLLDISDSVIRLNDEILKAFYLKIGDKLVAVKSTTVTMSCTPTEVWISVFKKHGFSEAIENLEKLEVY